MQIRRRSPSPVINVSIVQYKSAIEGAAPNNILEEIVWQKETEVEQMRERLPLRELQIKALSAPPTRDFVAALRPGKTHPALIAEVKKASPSKGVFREDFNPVAIAQSYQKGGASCLSVLTDVKFFQGSFENLSLVRSAVDLPLLCKDFIIYPYQMYWARIHGADAVLLIAAILNDQDLQYFIKIAHNLKMATLIEVHDLEELDRVLALDGVSLIGINNRNLEDFSVDLQTTCQLLTARGEQLQAKNILVVSESGLHHPEDLSIVKKAGASAVLIGESLVKQPDPQLAIANLFA
ncbi:indole-3-glycerol phosphate synthase TrpC [Dolichospermum sp. LEGE 00240]|uniref:indole-3-glycerol phosphate synthase TrpC n=1 Tax=Dolichospermum sp. LEGE 00240 TaxID=1828603 RepID=UPI00187FC4FA|nr:indole-3-glycerol phosphate synthase TrpC [Dolichospermum sp. LEGE 00240]MDM3845311.1 indole-3-glycerol phosphate synthase TrpC [Aphanizomenon gracile PMC638.10]MDM3849733.1 indole-3-glycerol phosphate synthase TrpC [Aphanizomenon gracile PMC627.10]MDM3857950.1 indole-3-glycerol phosphate synthase TrpC [Aphanizomenon gracile PMC649.10]MDM3859785.1 indole-3-glycerol phosphate synthase TrpC [Aphanizomenon gracile PMC644.10]MBE9251186.1 indole-3-glycerol phosphate synthase TrpC [Dolichospermum